MNGTDLPYPHYVEQAIDLSNWKHIMSNSVSPNSTLSKTQLMSPIAQLPGTVPAGKL